MIFKYYYDPSALFSRKFAWPRCVGAVYRLNVLSRETVARYAGIPGFTIILDNNHYDDLFNFWQNLKKPIGVGKGLLSAGEVDAWQANNIVRKWWEGRKLSVNEKQILLAEVSYSDCSTVEDLGVTN